MYYYLKQYKYLFLNIFKKQNSVNYFIIDFFDHLPSIYFSWLSPAKVRWRQPAVSSELSLVTAGCLQRTFAGDSRLSIATSFFIHCFVSTVEFHIRSITWLPFGFFFFMIPHSYVRQVRAMYNKKKDNSHLYNSWIITPWWFLCNVSCPQFAIFLVYSIKLMLWWVFK